MGGGARGRSRGAARRRCGDVCATMLDHRALTRAPNQTHHTRAHTSIVYMHSRSWRARARAIAHSLTVSTNRCLRRCSPPKRKLRAMRALDPIAVTLQRVSCYGVASRSRTVACVRTRSRRRGRAGLPRSRCTKGGGTSGRSSWRRHLAVHRSITSFAYGTLANLRQVSWKGRLLFGE